MEASPVSKREKPIWGAALAVAVLIVIAYVIRELWGKGTKPLETMYPWNQILIVVFVIIAIGACYFFLKRRS